MVWLQVNFLLTARGDVNKTTGPIFLSPVAAAAAMGRIGTLKAMLAAKGDVNPPTRGPKFVSFRRFLLPFVMFYGLCVFIWSDFGWLCPENARFGTLVVDFLLKPTLKSLTVDDANRRIGRAEGL